MTVEIVSSEEPDDTEEGTPVEVHGDVETIEEGDTTEVEEGDTIVTVTAPESDAVEAVVTEQVIEDAVTLALLSERFNGLDGRVFAVEMQLAEMERQQANDEAAVIETVEEIQEEIEDDEEDENEEEEEDDEREPASAGPHAMFRPWRDFFGKDK